MSYFPNAAISATGAAVPTVAEQVAGSDGTNLRAIATDTGGQVKVLVEGGTGAPVTQGTSPWVVGQATGTNLHAVIDSGTLTTVAAVTAITNALPAGANVIGHVITDTGSVVAATLAAETTKVIGTVNQGTSPWVVSNSGTFAVQAAATIADGADVTQGAKADAKSTATDTTAVSVMSVLKEISFMEQTPASRAVTNAGTFAVQAAATLAAETTKVIGTVNIAASQTIAVTNTGTFAAQAAIADGADVTQGAKADAKSTATDTTAVSVMSVLKEISFMEQTPASRAVTNAGTFAVQAAQSTAAASTAPWPTRPGAPTTGAWSTAVINFSASGDNIIVTGTAAQTVRVYKIQFTVAGATGVLFGDQHAAVSGRYVMTGNGSSFADYADGEPLWVGTSGDGAVINSTNAVSVQGQVWYTKS